MLYVILRSENRQRTLNILCCKFYITSWVSILLR